MQFTRLKLAGFKSFVDPMELWIEPGLTGVVGPNGCGKSNLVEALRWAMGETSAKQLRGSEMDDVIFAGTDRRPGRNIAEVRLELDNADRTAPAAFNDEDRIEITRRIERAAGSAYEINGRDVRARDVRLLFADAATGAHSTALVSQGQIGTLISAKPVDRRSLLEEAAGITGLHSRRHEAELRLRAAENNLARLDDIIVTLEQQLESLKRQARQAGRYRRLADHIRRAEALLFHLRWAETEAQRESAEAKLDAASQQVTQRSRLAAEAATEQAEAAAALPPLRQTEAAAAAELQRLVLEREGLEAEEQRIAQALDDCEKRLAQIGGDLAREQSLAADASAALENIARERAALLRQQEEEQGALETAKTEFDEAGAALQKAEAEATHLGQALAAAEAAQHALANQITAIEKRRETLQSQLEDARRQRHEIDAALETDAIAKANRDATAAADTVTAAEAAQAAASQKRDAASAAETAARQALQSRETAFHRLEAEIETLERLLADGRSQDGGDWVPVADHITVTAGYEAAIGAALGDDLEAALNVEAPAHWRERATLPGLHGDRPDPPSPPLPGGIPSLADFVEAPAALLPRLRQTGVASDAASARALADQLVQGQRLVTREGDLWRWDGYVALAGANQAAARLAQRNRLKALKENLATATPDLEAARAALESASQQTHDAEEDTRRADQALSHAHRGRHEARDRLSALREKAAEMENRRGALDEAIRRLEDDLQESKSTLAAAREDLRQVEDLDQKRAALADLRGRVVAARDHMMNKQGQLSALTNEAAARNARLERFTAEEQSWRNRAEAANSQHRQLEERREKALAERGELAKAPAEIAAKREALATRIEEKESRRQHAADRLAEAETRQAEADRRLKTAEAELSASREERIRHEANVEQISQNQANLRERIAERLDCGPEETLALTEMKDDETPPDMEAVEARLQRLVRERDNMGPVNLRAEAEAEEVSGQIAEMQKEREDLLTAIARLRQGISSLNREGRERLLAAFKQVDTHFQKLFVRLFGGGHAYMKLTESDDPLEAGLEIFASPPGKKLQALSLLSGGERAMAALALLFAVFLTNPAPICVLDEVDAPLDDANVDRFCTLLEEIAESGTTRFLIITHHRMTMARMDRLYGVTMAERGVSQLVSVDLRQAEQMRETA